MNELQVFVFEKQQVRVVDRNGDPWFVARDVCDILGLQNPTETIRNFPKNERSVLSITEGSSNGVQQKREMNIVNEPGLYRLVFQSRKPEAEAFKTWVFTEVLPSIRKRGFYAAPGADHIEQDEWKKNFPYPFLLLDDAAKRMREMRLAVDKGKMTVKEWRRIVLGDFGLYKPSVDIIDFVHENLTITGNLADYVPASDLYARYDIQGKASLTKNQMTRIIKNTFPGLIYKQKKIDGYPVLVFCGCKLIKNPVRTTLKGAVNG
jgi:prophage antirepressor-like protein